MYKETTIAHAHKVSLHQKQVQEIIQWIIPFYLADNAKGTLCSINIDDVPLMNRRIKKSFNPHIPRVSQNMLGFRIIIACDSK